MQRLINLLEWKSTSSKVDDKLAKGALIPRDIYSTFKIEGLSGDAIILVPSTIGDEKIIDIPQIKSFTNKNGTWIASVLTIDSTGRPIDKPARVLFLNKDELVDRFDVTPFNIVEETTEATDTGASNTIIENPVETDTYSHDYNAYIDDCYNKVCGTLHSLANVNNIIESEDNTDNEHKYISEKTGAEVTLTYKEPDFLIEFVNEARGEKFTTSAALLGYDDAAEDASKIAALIVKALNKNSTDSLRLSPMAILDRFDAFLKYSVKVGFDTEKSYKDYINYGSSKNKLILRYHSAANDFPDAPDIVVHVSARIIKDTNTPVLDGVIRIGDVAADECLICKSIYNYTDMLRAAITIQNAFVDAYKKYYANTVCLNNSMPVGLYSYVPKYNFRMYRIAEYLRESLKKCDYIIDYSVSNIKDSSLDQRSQEAYNSLFYEIDCILIRENVRLHFVLKDDFSKEKKGKSVSVLVIDEKNDKLLLSDELLNDQEIETVGYRSVIDDSLNQIVATKLKIKFTGALEWLKDNFKDTLLG